MKKIALFAGTFDPFTKGHADVAKRALTLFDELYIGVGMNDGKKTLFTAEERVEMIRSLYAGEARIKVELYKELTVDFARKVGACVLVRGVRSCRDFEYERDMAELNRQLAGMETLLLVCDPAYAALSSSAVREMLYCGKNVSDFLPEGLKWEK